MIVRAPWALSHRCDSLSAASGPLRALWSGLRGGGERRDESGWTALMWAASEGHESTVRELLQHGADVDARDPEGRTATMQARIRGDGRMVAVLRELGADPAARDFAGRSASEAVEETLSSKEGWRPIFVRGQ